LFSIIHTTMKTLASCQSGTATVQEFSHDRGVVWTAPTLSTEGPLPYER
jgi:hypothetical protein